MDAHPPPAAPAPKPPLSERLRLLVETYGRVGIWVYAVIYVLTFGTFLVLALQAPVEPGAGRWAVWGAAYAGFKLTQPVRILAAVALTPFIARWMKKVPAAAVPTGTAPASDDGQSPSSQ